jgi:4-oxalmesaconate hydratase
VSRLFPDRFIPAAMLPQSPGVAAATCISELVKCVEKYGNLAINLNPDRAPRTGFEPWRRWQP